MHTQQLKNEIITSLDILPTESLEFLAKFVLFLKGSPGSLNPVSVPEQSLNPFMQLGQAPIDDEITDASSNHDRYIYGA